VEPLRIRSPAGQKEANRAEPGTLTLRNCLEPSRWWKDLALFGRGPATRVYLAGEATDLRKGFEGPERPALGLLHGWRVTVALPLWVFQ
jgi:hypothetical protein